MDMKIKDLHREFIAALPALYGPHPGIPFIAAPELTKTILPPMALLLKYGKADFTAVMREKKLTSKCFFQASRGV